MPSESDFRNFEVVQIKTSDGLRLKANHFKGGHTKAILVAPGFFNNKDAYLFKRMAEALHHYYDIINFDFRGHGSSDGFFSWTSREPLDLRAVVSYACDEGYQKIGVIGFSLGAASTLIEASQNRNISSVISVAAPYDLRKIDFRFWEPEMLNDLKLNLGPKGKGKVVRPGNPFLRKVRPIDAVSRIRPTPVLFIHGEDDWLIKPYHSERLFEKAIGPKELRLIPRAGHAEMIFDKYPDEFEKTCTNWFQRTL